MNENLRRDIASAFQTLLTDSGDWRANIRGLSFATLDDREA